MGQLFDLIVKHVPAPVADASGPFAMLATTLEADNFVGRILTGRVHSGTARLNMPVKVMRRGGKVMTGGRLKIGRAHVWTPVTNAQLVCRLLLEKKKNK